MNTTNSKGELAQLKVEIRAIEKGIIVSKPTRHESRYDCVLDENGKLLRAQVKYASGADSKTDSSVRVELRKIHKNHSLTYSSSEIDVLLVYVPRIDRVLVFGPKHFDGKSCINVRMEKPKNNQANVNWYEDFLW